MKTSNRGIELIKSHEGLKLQAYRDPVGVPTIGYGHTRGVRMGMRITEQTAEKYLREDVQIAETEVNRHNLNINQNQFDALVSFTFNLGIGNFRNSTLIRRIKANANDPDIRNQFNRWIYAGGKPFNGLIRRRIDEANLYFS